MKSICFICARYPTAITPTNHVFVQKLVWGMADQGVECSIISPVAINLNYKLASLPKVTEERTPSGAKVKLYFPRYISLGQKDIFGWNTIRLTTAFFYRIVEKQLHEFVEMPDAVYGHFLAPAGITAAKIGRKFGIPAFAAYGESTPWSIKRYGIDNVKKELENLDGIVSVSTNNKNTLLELNIFSEEKIKVFPNAVDNNHFYPRDKIQARRKYGFPIDAFIVAFVGQFSQRKGVLRVAEALKDLNNVYVIYAGKGEQSPNSQNSLYCGLVKPEEVPEFLSAADAFLLPTLNEGCCNAIIEAMACGLPVISSNLPFNYDILDKGSATLIDPENISEIRNAVIELRDNPVLREKYSSASFEKAGLLSQKNRSYSIWKWMEQLIDRREALERRDNI